MAAQPASSPVHPPQANPTPQPPCAPASRTVQLALVVVIVAIISIGVGWFLGVRNGPRPTQQEVGANPQYQVDLNRATQQQLREIPGVGAERAKAIVQYREARGGFRSIEELRHVSGFGDANFKKVQPYLKIESSWEDASELGNQEPLMLTRKSVLSTKDNVTPKTNGIKKLATRPVPINTADLEELRTIPGVGPVIAQNILAEREVKPFTSLDDVDKRVKGVGPKTIEKMKGFVVFDAPRGN